MKKKSSGVIIAITAIFRSLGHAIFICRQQRLIITTYLRFDRKRRRLIFSYIIAFLDLSLFLCFIVSSFYFSEIYGKFGKPPSGDSRNPARLLINLRGP